MRQISLREANQHFSSCIAEVEEGERLILTRRGRPVAEIRPFAGRQMDARREAARKKLRALLRKGIPMGGVAPTREEMHER